MDSNQFYELTVKVLSGDASKEEIQTFDQWLQNPEYRKIYEWLSREWNNEIKTSATEFDHEKGLETLRMKIFRSKKLRIGKLDHIKKSIRIAAVVLLTFGAGTWGYLRFYHADSGKPPLNYITVSTLKGERKQIQLSDGSHVHMNAETTLRYPEHFLKNKRNVELTGEAFFEVVHNPQQPFTVHSGDFETTVLGTSFNVLFKDNKNIIVTVQTGKVKVANRPQNYNIILIKGDQAKFDENTNAFTKNKVKPEQFTDWHKKILHFDKITVEEALKTMEQWYNIHIHCNSSQILKRKIRADYTDETLENILNDLQFMIDFKYKYENDSTIIIQ